MKNWCEVRFTRLTKHDSIRKEYDAKAFGEIR